MILVRPGFGVPMSFRKQANTAKGIPVDRRGRTAMKVVCQKAALTVEGDEQPILRISELGSGEFDCHNGEVLLDIGYSINVKTTSHVCILGKRWPYWNSPFLSQILSGISSAHPITPSRLTSM